MDRLAAMQVFVEIVDRGSLTAAADALDRSLPAVVRTLAALESHLDVVLLRRTTRRMSLTPEGTEYLSRCRQILADVVEAERAVGTGEGEPRGLLKITAPVLFGQMHVTPLVNAFLQRYPQVSTELVLLDRNVDLVEEGVDLGIRIGPLDDSSLVAVGVGRMRQVVCGSPGLLTRTGEPRNPSELTRLPCIRQLNLPRAGIWRFRDGRRESAVSINGPMACNQIAAARQACVDGIGFGRFLAYQVADQVSDRKLQVVLEDYEPPPVPVSLVYPGGRLVSARLRAAVDWLKQRLPERSVELPAADR
ncbi:MAG: LysR family transcriptional regulator [Xanthomonadales bacterium]|nr:LysR family transcriptional regulator [Xanthomonadales bacterium]